MTYEDRIEKFVEYYNETGSKLLAALLIPDIVDDSYFERDKPSLEVYECHEYYKKERISFPEITERLNELAQQNVPKSPIFTYKKRLAAFCEENRAAVKAEVLKELAEAEKIAEKEFYEKEKLTKIEMDEIYKEKYEKELQEYNLRFHPTQEYIEKEFMLYINGIKRKIRDAGRDCISIRFGAVAKLEYNSAGKSKFSCDISVDSFQDFSEYSDYKIGITPTGKISQRHKTLKELQTEYAQNIASLAFICAASLFNITMDAESVLVSCYVDYIDEATGNEKTGCIYSIIVPRNLMKTYKMENLNTVAALLSLEGSVDIRKDKDIYFVNPIEWNLDLGKDSPDNDNYDEEESEEEYDEGENDEDSEEYDDKIIFIDFRRFNVNLNVTSQFKEIFDATASQVFQLKDQVKHFVEHLTVFNDDFDNDNYAEGFCKFIHILSVLKLTDKMIFLERSESLEENFKLFFDNNAYAMGEIRKFLENNFFSKIANGEKVPLDMISNMLISHIVCDNDEDSE